MLPRPIAQDHHTPVLALARSMDKRCGLEAMHLGVADYLEKPVPPAEMVKSVRRHFCNRESGDCHDHPFPIPSSSKDLALAGVQGE